MKKLMIASVAATLLFSASAYALEAPAKASTCIGCHGADGNSVVPNFPKLAGQHASYTASQLKDFRDGVRKNATMAPFAKGLTDQEITDLANFYAAQQAK
ncbi:c-type cytochrome [Thiomicrorhabdus aquaedulcis]|uniref:c-type cytochrome n=1 Tax=Thiomicrorhabdus aquaedulcis TaxID=2211106 RepID=UPI000FD948EA|nr:cytochrome c [Thiomicrorhabdus aquaedulcis]